MDRFIAVLVSFALIIALACVVVASAAEQKTEVLVWMWPSHSRELYLEWNQELTRRFEGANPGATLQFEFHDMQKFVVASAAGVPPDVTLASVMYAQQYYESGLYRELNAYIESTPHMTPDNFLPASMVAAQKDGRIYGMPWSWEARSIYVNTSHLAEAGLSTDPEAIATWKVLVDYAKRLTKMDASGEIVRSGFITTVNTADFASFLYSNGGHFYSADETAVAFNSPQGVEALEFMHDWQRVHNAMRKGAVAGSDFDGEIASMVIRDTSSIPTLLHDVPELVRERLIILPIPQGPQSDGRSGVSWSNMWVIPSNAKHPDLAWEFIQLFLSPQAVVDRFVHWGSFYINFARLDALKSREFLTALREHRCMSQIPRIFNTAGPYPHIYYQDINRGIASLLQRSARDGLLAPTAAPGRSRKGGQRHTAALRQE